MSETTTPNAPEAPDEQAGLVELGTYPTERAAFDRGLVILAMGQDYWLVPSPEGYRLLIEPKNEKRARHQLARYEAESVGWPPLPPEDPARPYDPRQITPLLWCFSLVACFWAQHRWPGLLEDAGVLKPEQVFQHGQYWRLFTALFLHADFGHLLSNTVAGFFVVSVMLGLVGNRRGWLLLGLSAVLGNLFTATIHLNGAYQSLGASTAVFAALGLITGRSAHLACFASPPHRWRGLLISLATGLGLLALFGSGGLQTDLGAHLGGFAAGTLASFISGILNGKRRR